LEIPQYLPASHQLTAGKDRERWLTGQAQGKLPPLEQKRSRDTIPQLESSTKISDLCKRARLMGPFGRQTVVKKNTRTMDEWILDADR